MSLLLFVCLLAGCSALRFVYANGETFVYWWLNNYVDFTQEQKPWVKTRIAHLFEWHRHTQLRDYAQLLEKAQQDLQRGAITPAEVHGNFLVLHQRAVLAADKAIPALTELALNLDQEQIAHLEKKFASNNEKYRREYLHGSLEERQRLRYKKVLRQAEYWFGNFSDQQEAQIRAASDARPLNEDLWMAERLRGQQEMLQMLKKILSERPPHDVVAAMLQDYIDRHLKKRFPYTENKDFFGATIDGMAQLVTVIVNVATPAQKEHAAKRLQNWINDCHALAEKR